MILVENILLKVADKVVTSPAGARAGLTDDCGSIPGYENLVEATADPKYPERDQLLEWLGDPKAFSLDGINRYLKRLKI